MELSHADAADAADAAERIAADAGVRRCPVCADATARHLHTQRYALFDDSDLPRETRIVACESCGCVYARSAAAVDAYRRHYERHSKYAAAVQASGSGDTPLDAARLDALAAFIAGHCAADAAILDVGCGRGGLLRALRERSRPNGTGLDPSAQCVAAVREAGIAAGIGTLEAQSWPSDPARFDVVVLSHVLEHVFDASAVFDAVGRGVATRGAIYVEVPDASRYDVDGFPPFYFFDPEHINHFDADAIAALGARHGWHVAATWSRWLDLGGAQRYPAVGVLLRRGLAPHGAAPSGTTARTAVAAAIARYVARCDAMRSPRASDLAVLAATNAATPLVLWGAGSYAQRLLAQTRPGDAAVDCIIDQDRGKQGRRLAGHPVVTPDEGLARARAIGATIVVAVAVGADMVMDRLRSSDPEACIVRA